MHLAENTPDYWRMKAQQARALAANLKEPQAQEHMLAAAESYDRLAAMAEAGPLLGASKTATTNTG